MDNINGPGVTLGKDDVSSCTPPNVNTACKPSSGAIPKKQSTMTQLHKADEQEQTDTSREIQVVVAVDYNQLPVSDLDTTRGERTEKIEKNRQSLSCECPPQSLPPPEDNAITGVAKGNIEKDSGTDVSKAFNRLVSKVKSQRSNSGPKGPPSPEEVAVKLSVVVDYDGPEESGCPAENDEVPVNEMAALFMLLDKDTQGLVRKFHQMYIEKGRECKRLVEYTLQQDKRNHSANVQVAMLKKENIELSEELGSLVGKIEMQKLANEQKLQEEHGMFQRMAEEFKGFQESKRKQVKSIQVKLIKEKRKRKRVKIQLARERCQRKRVERELGRAKSKEKKMEKRKKKMEERNKKELRERTVQLEDCQAQCTRLQQDVKEFKAQTTAKLQSVQTSNEVVQRCMQDRKNLIVETQEMCRKATQMYFEKQEECKKLAEELRENNVQLDNCQAQNTRLLQDLEEFRAQVTGELQSVQLSSAVWQRRFQDRRKLIVETQEMCRKATQMYIEKENECKKLVEELRENDVQLENCQAQNTRLLQDFEWQRRFQESTELIAETQELCRKATQMYLWKEQECERMKKHIEQNEQKYDECNRDLENLGKECEEQRKELHSAFEMVEEIRLQYDNEQKLLGEREYDLDRGMVEMSQAFCEAESDKMEIMKVKLAEEIRQRKKMKRQLAKERNKRKRVELEKAIEKRRGKRMEKRKKRDTCQCLRKEEKGGPSGGTRGGYRGHVSRDEGDLSSIASSEEESSEKEITTGPDDSLENEDTK